METEDFDSRLSKMRADLIATNLAIEAICASMSPQAHQKLMTAWAALDAQHQKTLDLFEQGLEHLGLTEKARTTHKATVTANKHMGSRLAQAPQKFPKD